jgi:secreted PhoX family phosphatase
MACFAGPRGTLVLMRNHENPLGVVPYGPSLDGSLPAGAFDALGMGGVSRVVLDGASLEKVSGNLVLAGTVLNCAGGPSPWGWLSCEETVQPGHGWVFACPTDAERAIEARPIRAYGRFRHEAVAVDPESCVAYLTEDEPDSCVYRFVPHDAAREPFEGQFFAMTIRDRPRLDLGAGRAVGERLEIGWVPIEDAAPEDGSLRLTAQRAGAAIVRRGEGIAFHAGERGPELALCATAGGPVGAGQIFRLRPEGEGGELELLTQSESTDQLDMPDNIVVSPRGHVFFCEDGSGRNHIRAIDSRDGSVYDFARNVLSGSELAGVCFSPDERAMFVSLQTDGITLSITGPFDRLG